MAHIGNILRDKLFVFSGSTKTTDAEGEILNLIAEKEQLGDIIRSSLIDNEDNYDSYKVETPIGEYLIKTSLDPEYDGFKRESEILNQIWELNLAPQAISCGEISYGEKIFYLITTFENAQSASELGKSIILFNYEESLKRIKSFHALNYLGKNLQERIQDIFAATNFDNQPEFADMVKADSGNYQLLNDEILGLKQYIQESYKAQFSGETLCHGSINPSTLLLGPTKISFINWQNAFSASPLIDLSNLRMEFDYDEDFEFKLVNCYSSLGKNYSWDEYLAARNFWAAIKLLEYVFSYVKEIYLFQSMRQDKILKIFSAFCRNIRFFEHTPSFKKNKEQLLNLFSGPML